MKKHVNFAFLTVVVIIAAITMLPASADNIVMLISGAEGIANTGKYSVSLDEDNNVIFIKANQPLEAFVPDSEDFQETDPQQWAGITVTLQSANYFRDGEKLDSETFTLWMKCDEAAGGGVVMTFTLEPTDEISGEPIPASAVEYTVKFVPHMTVTLYYGYEDSVTDSMTVFCENGAVLADIIPDTLTREGYDIAGWFADEDEEFDSTAGITADMTLHAEWKIKTYTVTLHESGFDADGGFYGLDPTVLTFEYGSNVTPDPDYAAYFVGWFTDETKTEPFYGTVSDDVVLYAKYSAVSFYIKADDSGEYTLWDGHGGIPATQYRVPIQVIQDNFPTPDGHSFAGWYTSDTLQNGETRFNYSKGLQQQFPQDVEHFKLYAGYNGPSALFVNAYNQVFLRKPTVNDRAEAPTADELHGCAVPNGYQVLYWVERESTDFYAENPGIPFDFDDDSAEEKILRPFISQTVWLVEFDTGDGGSATAYQIIENGGRVSYPGPPSRLGYIFKGYYNGETEWNFSNPVNTGTNATSGTLQLTAKWTPDTTRFVINVWREKSDMPAGMDGTLEKATLTNEQKNKYENYDLIASVAASDLTGSVQTQTQIEAAIAGKVKIELLKHNKDNSGYNINLGISPLDCTKFSHANSPQLRGDGTTVIDAFYIRDVYKIEFHRAGTSASGRLTSTTLDPSCRTVYVKYEQNVTEIWPDRRFAGFTNESGWGSWAGRIGYMDWNTSRYCDADWARRTGTENGYTVDGGMQYILENNSNTYSYVAPTYLKISSVKTSDGYFIHEGVRRSFGEATSITASTSAMPATPPKYIRYAHDTETDVFLHVYTSKYSNATTNGHDIRAKGHYTYETLMNNGTDLDNKRNFEKYSKPKYKSVSSGVGTYYYFYESLPVEIDYGFDDNNMNNVVGIPAGLGSNDAGKKVSFDFGDTTLDVMKALTGFTEGTTAYVEDVTGVTYVFRGYFLDTGHVTKIDANSTLGLYNVIYTKWEPVPFKVYVTNGFGSNIGIVDRRFGDPMLNPSDVKFWGTAFPGGGGGYTVNNTYIIDGKEYVFDGWEVGEDELHYQLSVNMVAKRSYTITAKWHSIVGSYWIEYGLPESQDDTVTGWMSPADTLNPYAEGAEIIVIQPPTPQIRINNEIKEFAYWTDASDNVWEVGTKPKIGGYSAPGDNQDDYMIYALDKTNKQHGAVSDCTDGDDDNCPMKILLTPRFISKYRFLFDHNYYGGPPRVESRFYESWQNIVPPALPRDGWRFDGWFLDAEYTISAGSIIIGKRAADAWVYHKEENGEPLVRLYAKWKPKVEWRRSNGVESAVVRNDYVEIKTLRSELTPPTQNCVWYSDESCTVEVLLNDTQITAPLTLYTPELTVNYFINGEKNRTDKIIGASAFTFPKVHGKALLWKADADLSMDWADYSGAAEWYAESDKSTMTLNAYSQAVKVVYHITEARRTVASTEYRTIGETISRTSTQWFTDEEGLNLWDNETILTDADVITTMNKDAERIYELNLYSGAIELALTAAPMYLYYTEIGTTDEFIAISNTVNFLVNDAPLEPLHVLEYMEENGSWTEIAVSDSGRNVPVEVQRDTVYRVKRGVFESNTVEVKWLELGLKPLS